MSPLFRLGLLIPSAAPSTLPARSSFDHVVDVATTAEASGFDSLWVLDAPGVTGDGSGPSDAADRPGSSRRPRFEAYTLLGALAARTTRARLGALGGSLAWRNPAVLVKQVTAVDVLSGGRALLGIGGPPWVAVAAGHPTEVARAERRHQLEEGLLVCRALFAVDDAHLEGGGARFEGRHYRLAGAVNRPPPRQAGGVPVVLTGVGEEGMLALVARYADACVLAGDAAHVQSMVHALARHCQELGRDPATVTTVHIGPLVIARSAEELGARIDRAEKEMGGGVDLWRGRAVVGLPDEVVGRMGSLLDTGVDGVVVHMPGADLDAVALAGATLGAAFGGDHGT